MNRRITHLLFGLLLLPTAAVADEPPLQLPDGSHLDRIDFDRHVAPMLSRLGCNTAKCHGSFQGKGGLRLSLFGSSAEADYREITRGAQGRRINTSNVDTSLLLRKPALQVSHAGGRRMRKDSWQYATIRRWIDQGALRNATPSDVTRLEATLQSDVLESCSSTSIVVMASFSDGTRQEVTPFCSIQAHDDSVAQLNDSAIVHARQPGDTAIIAEYCGKFVTTSVLVPVPETDQLPWPELRVSGFIDEEVFLKLKAMGITPAEACSDTDFFRRITIDTIGRIPTPSEVREFLDDPAVEKRSRVVEQLLTDPMHAVLWATRLCDITGNDVTHLPGEEDVKPKQAKMWHDWFRIRVAENVPYDEIVKGVLLATSRGELPLSQWIAQQADLVRSARDGFESDYADGPYLDLYWQRPQQQIAEVTAAAFLGVRIECAQCHKHPFDRWTQHDYRAFSNIFARVRSGSSPELRAAVTDLLDQRRQRRTAGKPLPPPLPRLVEVYLDDRDSADSFGADAPQAFAGLQWNGAGDARRDLYEWLVEPDNPFFARSIVNRVWAHYFGVGLVDPVDDFSVINPPSHPELLDKLSQEFVRSGYDIRQLERTILNSQVYQLATTPNRTNRRDQRNYSRSYVRVMPAEVSVDSLQTALGVTFDFGPDVPHNCRAIEIAPNQLRNSEFTRVFDIFSRPRRKTACDCERNREPSIRQTLFLMSDPLVLGHIPTGRLKRLLDGDFTDYEITVELFLATLSRFPTADEQASVRQHLQQHDRLRDGFPALFWALLNTREFVTNH